MFTLLGGKSHGVFHYGRLHTVPKVGLFIPGIPFAKIQNFLPFSKYFAILFRKNLIFNICFRKQRLRGGQREVGGRCHGRAEGRCISAFPYVKIPCLSDFPEIRSLRREV